MANNPGEAVVRFAKGSEDDQALLAALSTTPLPIPLFSGTEQIGSVVDRSEDAESLTLTLRSTANVSFVDFVAKLHDVEFRFPEGEAR